MRITIKAVLASISIAFFIPLILLATKTQHYISFEDMLKPYVQYSPGNSRRDSDYCYEFLGDYVMGDVEFSCEVDVSNDPHFDRVIYSGVNDEIYSLWFYPTDLKVGDVEILFGPHKRNKRYRWVFMNRGWIAYSRKESPGRPGMMTKVHIIHINRRFELIGE